MVRPNSQDRQEKGRCPYPTPTIQEVLDIHFPGEYIAEELVMGDERINLEDENGGKAKR